MGVRTGIPCPIDDPVEMLGWWEKMREKGEVERGPSTKMQAVAARVQAATGRRDGDDDDTPKESSAQMTELLAKIAAGETTFDYADGLKIAERNIQVLDLLLTQAIEGRDFKAVSLYRKQLTEAGDAYRQLMKDRGKIQADAGETLPKSEVRSSILELHQNIQKRFRQEIKGFFPDLEEYGKSREEWNFRVDELVDRICGGLVGSRLGE